MSRVKLNNRIRWFRKRCLLSQSDLAELCYVSKNTVSSWENYDSYPTAYHAALLCDLFKCDFFDLFYFD